MIYINSRVLGSKIVPMAYVSPVLKPLKFGSGDDFFLKPQFSTHTEGEYRDGFPFGKVSRTTKGGSNPLFMYDELIGEENIQTSPTCYFESLNRFYFRQKANLVFDEIFFNRSLQNIEQKEVE